ERLRETRQSDGLRYFRVVESDDGDVAQPRCRQCADGQVVTGTDQAGGPGVHQGHSRTHTLDRVVRAAPIQPVSNQATGAHGFFPAAPPIITTSRIRRPADEADPL